MRNSRLIRRHVNFLLFFLAPILAPLKQNIQTPISSGQRRMYSISRYPTLSVAGSVPVDGGGGGPHVPLTGAGVRVPHLKVYAQV